MQVRAPWSLPGLPKWNEVGYLGALFGPTESSQVCSAVKDCCSPGYRGTPKKRIVDSCKLFLKPMWVVDTAFLREQGVANPVCPKCSAKRTTRTKRRGFFQRLFFEEVGRYPWRCGVCGHKFISNERGEKKKEKRNRQDATLLPLPPTPPPGWVPRPVEVETPKRERRRSSGERNEADPAVREV